MSQNDLGNLDEALSDSVNKHFINRKDFLLQLDIKLGEIYACIAGSNLVKGDLDKFETAMSQLSSAETVTIATYVTQPLAEAAMNHLKSTHEDIHTAVAMKWCL